MSTHFTYEIDERKLRVKLRDLEDELNEEAWQSYELFSGPPSRSFTSDRLSRVQLPLNRNVIVPLVFATLVVLFSIILFKFININPENREEPGQQEVPQAVLPAADTTAKGIEPGQETVKATTLAPTRTNLPPATKTATNNSTVSAANSAPANQATLKQKVEIAPVRPKESPANPVNTLAATSQSPDAAVTPTTGAKPGVNDQSPRKKKKRRAEEVEAEPAIDTRPAIGADERDTEERPN